ncbi:D-glycero-beta-D-manno-heptose 1-phosphate adenylyltransferase [Chitinophaga sp.]|uniref:D-glycero-beta-D-manno-heptose 1-phosphate adenylyltransferase n=1 Tax=Chitinophaga sp. TaxID=1869181 RepID=UPI0031D63C99
MTHQFHSLVNNLHQPAVLVIGDLILDTYLRGASTRLTPEAPVPVVDITSHTCVPGGAANTAINLRYLGADVTFAGIVGEDTAGKEAQALLAKEGIHTFLISCNSRNTIVKTRVIAGSQLLTRYDEGTETPVPDGCEEKLIAFLENTFDNYDAIVIADYNKGVITPPIIAALERLNPDNNKFIAVDAKRLDLYRSLRPSLVKPNYHEVMQLLQLPETNSYRAEQLRDMGSAIHRITGARVVALTLDAAGALIFKDGETVCHTPAYPVSEVNVSGAGDTYISAFTMSCLSGMDLRDASEMAAAAAAIVISKADTAYCAKGELMAFFSMHHKYLDSVSQLKEVCAVYRAQGKRIVFTNGCFDILHSGHVNYLTRARELGDVLIVGINNDESIKRLKGSTRPINQLQDRMEVLGGLGAVNHIIPFGNPGDDTPIELIRAIAPDVFTKGGDYTREGLPEAEVVEELGGIVTILPVVPDRSTTSLIRRIHTTPVLKVAQG